MRMKWLAPAIALSAVLFGVINVRGQALIGPNSKGGWNAYMRDGTAKGFIIAEEDARNTDFPGYTVNGVEVIPPSTTKGHLVTLQGKQEHDFVAGSVGFGWLGLSDDPDYGGEEGGPQMGFPYPAFKDGSTELRVAPTFEERGFGWVWTTGEPFDYQAWNGNDEPNDAGGEHYVELVAGGYNDLGTQTIASLIEWELNLATNPIVADLDLSVVGGKLHGKVAATTSEEFGSKALTGDSWYVSQEVRHVLREPGAEFASGLTSTWVNGNHTNDAAWNTALANPALYIAPPFLLDKISYGNGTPHGYPPVTGMTGNRDNYSVQWEGEIFIPQGTVTFWDGNDDYTKLEINGVTLIDDNTWTSWDGQGNAGQAGTASFDGTKNDAEVEGLKGGWYPILFRGAEGGGGDNFRLVWDASDGTVGQTGGDIDAPYLNPNADPDTYFTVASPFFRAKDPGLTVGTTVRLGLTDSQGNPAGYIGTGGIDGELPTNDAVSINLSGEQTLTLTAVIGGQTFTHTEVVDFGGGSPPGIPGDVDGNGKVDLTDFGIVKDNFGKSAAAGAAVPEPSTLALLGLGGLCGLVAAARRRRK